MKKLLISGFEPFGGENINPSWEAVNLLPSEIKGYAITKIRIPVVFGKAADMVMAKVDEMRPDVIICVGQAGGRDAITPELVAINLRHAEIPDNEGNQPFDRPITEGGETAYLSTLPMRKIAAAIKESGLPSRLSYSAGAYVCNDLIYTILQKYKNTNIRAGFIHIPYSIEQGKDPSMPLSDLVKGLTIAIESIDNE